MSIKYLELVTNGHSIRVPVDWAKLEEWLFQQETYGRGCSDVPVYDDDLCFRLPVHEHDLLAGVVKAFPAFAEMVGESEYKTYNAALAVEAEIAEVEAEISRFTQESDMAASNLRLLHDKRETLTRAAGKHAEALGDYRNLRAAMEAQK